jgi:hypothetical protein
MTHIVPLARLLVVINSHRSRQNAESVWASLGVMRSLGELRLVTLADAGAAQ